MYDLKQDKVQPSQRLQPPAGSAASGKTTAIAFVDAAGGDDGVLAHGLSSGHVVIWKLPAALAVGGGGEEEDAQALNSILGGEVEQGAAFVGDEDDDCFDFTPAPPAPLMRLSEAAEPAAKQQQQQQQQKQQQQQPASVPAAHSSSAADSDGGDSLDGDTPW